MVCLITVTMNCLPASAQPSTPKSPARLIWQSGDSIPGNIVSFDDEKLQWQAGTLFGKPFEIDRNALNRAEFSLSTADRQSVDPFIVQLIDGMNVTGVVRRLNDQTLTVFSDRFGEIEIDRRRVATILNRQNAGSLINGRFDLELWDAKRGEKKYWSVDERGALQSKRKNIHLFYKNALPDSLLIELELTWQKSLDFSFGFGVPENARKIGDLPRLESWDGAIVLSFGDDFETVLEAVDEKAKKLKLLIHWNRVKHQIVIHDEKGRQLAGANIGKPGKKVSPGIFIENKSGDLAISALTLRNSTADFDATQPSIQQLNTSTINAVLESFDGTTWKYSPNSSISQSADDQEETTQLAEEVKVPSNEFCGAFLINSAVDHDTGKTILQFGDGMFLSGELMTIAAGTATVKTNFTTDAIKVKLEGLTLLQFPPSTAGGKKTGANPQKTMEHQLQTRAGEIRGRLEQGSGVPGDVLRWRLPGATAPVPFNSGDARIILKTRNVVPTENNQSFGDTLYFKNRDIVPCHIEAMDEKSILIQSFVENRRIDQSLVKAVDFQTVIVADSIAVNDPGWKSGTGPTKKFKIKGDKISIIGKAEFGHPHLLASGKLEFDLEWRKNQYGLVECQALVNDVSQAEGGKKFYIAIYGEAVFVSNSSRINQVENQVTTKDPKVHVTVEYRGGKLAVRLNGKRAWSSKVTMGQNQGRGIRFRLKDLYSQNMRCDFSNFKLGEASSGSSTMIDSERKALLLTIPRLKRLNPPRQIVCATNGDMLRGDLLAIDGQSVKFRANHEDQRFPRAVVDSIVWLHADHLTGKENRSHDSAPAKDRSDETVAETDSESTARGDKRDALPQVQILMSGNRRMTAEMEAWKDGVLLGRSETLGQCQVPLDEIYELRMGSFAVQATDVPYADWIAELAPEPKMDGGGRSGEDGILFGELSPLIGTQAKPFKAKTLDGKEVSLASLQGGAGGAPGKVVVLDFWATWCGPCVKALPGVVETVNAFPQDKVAFLAINQEEGGDTIRKFMQTRDLDFPVALDPGTVGTKFSLEMIPLTIVIDPKGKIAFVKTGGNNDHSKLKTAIEHLLSGKRRTGDIANQPPEKPAGDL